jgi:ubiquinone/menaquinone biosynthesis C-methylase UbiE
LGSIVHASSIADVRHPIFARFFDRLSRVLEKEVGAYRDELLSGLSGRVLEVGAGNGINFSHYPATVDEVIAVEPEPYMRARAEEAAKLAPVRVSVRSGVADALGLEDGSVDAAVASLVLCSVPDQATALTEIRRVTRPGGELRFLEHVRSQTHRKARVQGAADRYRVWPLMAGGCHCARDTVGAIRGAGFEVVKVRDLDVGPSWNITNPHVLGKAMR